MKPPSLLDRLNYPDLSLNDYINKVKTEEAKECYDTLINEILALYSNKMTEEQIQMLRFLIQQEIEYAQIDPMEHGVWGWAEKQADENWKKFQESFDER